MKYVSFSLWGPNPVYCAGAIKNARLYPVLFNSWQVIIWHDNSVPKGTIDGLKAAGAMLRDCSRMTWCPPCMWRFLVNDMPDCDRFISRDCDSRPILREAFVVNEWEKSGRPFHLIRDHPNHGMWPILAGMWGCMKGFINGMDGMIKAYRTPHTGYGHDQNFLRDAVWPKAQHMSLQHDCGCRVRYKGTTPLPRRSNHHFIGERYDENDSTNAADAACLPI